MALKLRVVSEQRRALGDRASIVVGVGGGSIGRSADNDWVLPDPMRYISGRHARIHFRLGAYYLEDVSTNGIFVNDADRPISRQGLYLLKNGDLVRLGDYQLLVTLEESAEAAEPPVLSPNAADTLLSLQTDTEPDAIVVTPVAVPETGGSVAHTDIGASLNLQALIERPPPAGAGLRATNARGQALAAQLPEPEPEPEPHIVPGEAVARRMERLARAAATSRPATPFYDVATGLNAFCRGAGLDPSRLPADAQTRMLHIAGQIFREALVGLRDLHQSQHELHHLYRIDMPKDEDETRPSLDRGGVEELAEALLASHDSRRIDAVQWLRESFATAKRHDAAALAATRHAFAEFINRLAPAELETRFGRAAKIRGAVDKSAYWKLYSEFYRNVCEMPADGMPHVYVDAFARTYLELAKKPQSDKG